MKPDELVVADLEGKVLDGKGSVPKEWPIDTAVHRARRDVPAVALIHPIPPCLPLPGARTAPLRFKALCSGAGSLYSRTRT